GTVNGFAFRGELNEEWSLYYLNLGPAWLRDSGLSAGSLVEVAIGPEGPLGDRLPADVRAALEADAQAKAFFESLPTFYRNNFMRSIEGAKRPETRAARIAEMMDLLKARKRQK
ncbi:MAG: YdeI/OmpD-associated family protein, partial [Anaerolineaceae bacterium]|nr:YdeI/OmpD-associated family protein [Anaerolineaceae bacterium]